MIKEKENNILCDSCLNYIYKIPCLFRRYKRIDICPCIECLVKSTCVVECKKRSDLKRTLLKH